MPLTYTVSHRHRLVTAIAKGTVATDEISHCLVAMAEQGALAYAKLFDATAMEGEWGRQAVLSFAAFSRVQGGLRRLGPLAIVIGSVSQRAQAALYVRKSTARRSVRLFADRQEAQRWLDEPHP